MKHFSTYLFSLLLMGLISWGCSDQQSPTAADRDKLENTSLMKTGFSSNDPLMPTGNSTTDTENLQEALHDASLDAGGTLYLGLGTFEIHRVLGRQSLDPTAPSYSTIIFNGTIQGAGKGVTIIKAMKGPNGENFEPLSYTWPGDPEPTRDYTLLAITQTYLSVKDLTLDSEPEILDDPDNGSWFGGSHNLLGGKGPTNFLGLGSLIGASNQLIGTDIINVHFKGTVDASGNPTTGHQFQQYGDQGGVHNIKGCEFENSFGGALQFIHLPEATINIGGNPKDKVTLTNCVRTGVEVWAGNNCILNVSHIETYDAAGVYFVSGNGNTHSNVNVTRCDINCRTDSYYAGVEIWATIGEVYSEISENKIHSQDSWLWGPIYARGQIQALIKNNKFTGLGWSAIYLGVVQALYARRVASATLRGNNLQQWNNYTGLNPWGLPAADIWFGSYTINSFVYGGGDKVNVLDEPGYDWNSNSLPPDAYGNAQTYEDPLVRQNIIPKNNSFKGVNVLQLTESQGLSAGMQRKVEKKEEKMKQLKRR